MTVTERARRGGNLPDLHWWLLLAAVFLLLLLINPNGFIGGGQDDWQYLNAARCWREFGPCLPHDHWQGRWPVVAPIAAFTEILGESRLSVSIAPFLASVLSIVLLAVIGNRLFNPPIGWIAALLFLTIAAFTFQLTQPSVEATELAFILAGFFAVLNWRLRCQRRWAFAAGLAFSLAFQVRETAAIAAVFALAYVLAREPRPKVADVLWASAGFAIPIAIELVVFALSTGDPFWRRQLSIVHTRVPSSELLGDVDQSDPPFFNKDYIANWRMQPGLRIHWSVDGIANLLVNAFAGLSLVAVPLVAAFSRSAISMGVRRAAMILWLTALLYIGVLIYAFAIDPKPRVMLVPLLMTTVALALLTWHLHEHGRPAIARSIWLAAIILVLPFHIAHQRTDLVEGPAAKWLREHSGEVEIDGNTRRHLALVPAAQGLPDLNADKPYLLYMSVVDCPRWIASDAVPSGTFEIVERASVSTLAPLDSRLSAELCLLRYKRHVPGNEIRKLIRWSRDDGAVMVGKLQL